MHNVIYLGIFRLTNIGIAVFITYLSIYLYIYISAVNAVLVKLLPDLYQSRYNSSVIKAKPMDTISSAINVNRDTSSAINVITDTSS